MKLENLWYSMDYPIKPKFMEDKTSELQAEKERILATIAESEKHIEHHKKTVHWDKKRLRLVEQQLEDLKR